MADSIEEGSKTPAWMKRKLGSQDDECKSQKKKTRTSAEWGGASLFRAVSVNRLMKGIHEEIHLSCTFSVTPFL